MAFRRTSSVKVRFNTAAAAQAFLQAARDRPESLDVQWGEASLRLRANVERSAAEAAVAAPVLRAARLLRGRGLSAQEEVNNGRVYDADEEALAERQAGRMVLTARGAATGLRPDEWEAAMSADSR